MNAEIYGSFSDLNGIGLSLNKIVQAKIIEHVFIFIYLSTVIDSHRLGHYVLGIDDLKKKLDSYIRYNSLQPLLICAVPDWAIVNCT